MERTVYWQNPPADSSLIDQMDSRLPAGAISHESRPDRWITTFRGRDESEIDELMERYQEAYSELVGKPLATEE